MSARRCHRPPPDRAAPRTAAAATAETAWLAFAERGRGAADHIADLVFTVCGAIALGLLIGAARIGAKAARHEAILR